MVSSNYKQADTDIGLPLGSGSSLTHSSYTVTEGSFGLITYVDGRGEEKLKKGVIFTIVAHICGRTHAKRSSDNTVDYLLHCLTC